MGFSNSVGTGINSLGSGYNNIMGSVNGVKFMNEGRELQEKAQENQLNKLRTDIENQRVNGIVDSAANAASAAFQIKVQY